MKLGLAIGGGISITQRLSCADVVLLLVLAGRMEKGLTERIRCPVQNGRGFSWGDDLVFAWTPDFIIATTRPLSGLKAVLVPGADIPDLAIGRIPVSTDDEADRVREEIERAERLSRFSTPARLRSSPFYVCPLFDVS